MEYYLDFADDLIISLIKKTTSNSFVHLRLNLLRNTNIIHSELRQVENTLKTLFLQKELKNYLKQLAIPTAEGFLLYLQSKNLELSEFQVEATKLWNHAAAYAHSNTSYVNQFKHAVSGYSFDSLHQLSGLWDQPFVNVLLFERNYEEHTKKQMDIYLTQQIARLSENLNQNTLIPTDLLQEASSEEILSLSKINYSFILEINLLKKSLESYIEVIKPESFGWFGRWIAKMDGRMKYLNLAEGFKKELDNMALHDPNATENLKALKQTIAVKVKENAYFLFKNRKLSEHLTCILQSPTLIVESSVATKNNL